MTYFATFTAGAYAIIGRQLKSFSVDELKIVSSDESSVVFESSLRIEKLIELRYFTNVYLLVDDFSQLPKSALKGGYFRLMQLVGGVPKALEPSDKLELESKIRSTLRLQPNAKLSKNDFYAIKRAQGSSLLGLKLARAKFKRERLQPGELRPELTHILCLVAGLKAKNIVADTFAGHGAIPLEAVRGFGCKDVIAVDSRNLGNRHKNPAINWHKADARNLDFLPSESVDKIVTDPPWGIYDDKVDIEQLYSESANEFARVLKPGGVAVVLTGYALAGRTFTNTGRLKMIGRFNVLVSGKKATIYKLQKD